MLTLDATDGRLVVPALSVLSILGVVGGLVLLGMGDGRHRAKSGPGRIRARPAPTAVAPTMSTGTQGGMAVSEARDPERALR